MCSFTVNLNFTIVKNGEHTTPTAGLGRIVWLYRMYGK